MGLWLNRPSPIVFQYLKPYLGLKLHGRRPKISTSEAKQAMNSVRLSGTEVLSFRTIEFTLSGRPPQ